MIGVEDGPHTFEYKEYFKILPAIHNWSKDPERIKDGKRVEEKFKYSSDNNLIGWVWKIYPSGLTKMKIK